MSVTKEELLQMGNLEVYHEAVGAGVERATKHGQFDEWLGQNPAFADPGVRAKMQLGAGEDLSKVLERVSRMKGTVRVIVPGLPVIVKRDTRKPPWETE